MLQKLHDHIKGWVATVVLGLICLAFVLWGVQSYVSSGGAEGQTLATVEGKKITEKQVLHLSRQLQRQYVAAHHALTAPVREQIKAMALQQLVTKTALLQAALNSGYYVGHSTVQQFITSIPQFQRQGRFSPQLFQQVMYASGMTQDQFIHDLGADMLISQVATGIQLGGIVLPNELETYYNLIYQVRDFSYLVIPAKKFTKSITVTREEEETYYQNNQDQFKQPEQVGVSYVRLSKEALGQTVTLSDQALQDYYKAHRANFRTPAAWVIERISIPFSASANEKQVAEARQKMQALVTKLKSGASFAALLKEQKGTQETITEGLSSAQIVAQVKKMQLNQVSAPFNLLNSYTIIRLLKASPAETRSFAQVKEQIRNRLVNQKIQQRMGELNDELASLTYTNPDSLLPAAHALKLKVQESSLFSRRGAKEGIAASPSVVSAAFSEDVLRDGNNSAVLTLKDGSLVVLRVKQHVKSSLRPFAEVRAQIHHVLLKKMAQAKAALAANQALSRLQRGVSERNVVQALHVSPWVNKSHIGRTNKLIPTRLLQTAFSLSLQQKNSMAVVALDNGDAAVLVLKKIADPDFKRASLKQKQALQKELQQFLGTLTYQLYVHGVMQKLKIKFHK